VTYHFENLYVNMDIIPSQGHREKQVKIVAMQIAEIKCAQLI